MTALDVLEHIDNDAAALVDLRRVLRPGGLLPVTVPAFAFLWVDQDEISHHTAATERRIWLLGSPLPVCGSNT